MTHDPMSASVRKKHVLYPLLPLKDLLGNDESLTSYIVRLSQAHSVSVKDLLFKEINQEFGRSYLYTKERPNSHTFWKKARALNSTGEWAVDMAAALKTLTGVQGLAGLTCVRWRKILGYRKLLKPHLAWCPDCYKEWGQKHLPLIQLLSWQLDVVQVCSKHRKRLLNQCPHCGKAIPTLMPYMQNGVCPFCFQLLYDQPSGEGEKEGEDWLAWQLWRAQMAQRMLRTMRHQKGVDPEALPEAIDQCLLVFGDNSISELAKICNVGITSIRDWLNGKQKIHLETYLKICGNLQVDPTALLFHGHLVHSPVMPINVMGKASGKGHFNLGLLEKKLVHMRFQDETPPPSLAEVARRIGHDSSHLRKLFPALCEEIVNRHARYMHIQHERKIMQLQRELRQVIWVLEQRGEMVTEKAVRELLEKPGVLRHL